MTGPPVGSRAAASVVPFLLCQSFFLTEVFCMVTSFKEATGDMVMYSFEFLLCPALDEGKCQNMVRPAGYGQLRAARGR